MPNQLRGEFVNVGVVLQVDGLSPFWQFTNDISRMQFLDPDLDAEIWEHFQRTVVEIELPADYPLRKGQSDLIGYLYYSLSCPFQLGEIVAGRHDNPLRQIDHYFKQLVVEKEVNK
jgi:hypothetical protein